MRARVLVVKVADSVQDYIEIRAIADGYTMDDNPDWLQVEQVEVARKDHGDDLLSHGFVAIEIPDAVIESVTRQHADAGTVEAKAVGQ